MHARLSIAGKALAGISLISLAGPVLAQSESGAAHEGDAERANQGELIVVTGSRIRGAGAVGSPVIQLGRDEIEASGADDVTELLREVPQVFALGSDEGSRVVSNQNAGLNRTMGSGLNLRGVGASATLVLLNGHRIPQSGLVLDYVDAGTIPAGVVERVEILPDGSSAVYGSDAVAGVVNFVTRRSMEGGETSIRYGLGDDYQTWQASHVQGISWGSGDLIVAGEYRGHTNLAGRSRDFYRQDLREFGGADRRTNLAAPGNIVYNGATYALPEGDGVGLTAADLVPGTVNLLDQFAAQDILPEQERKTGFIAGRQDIGSRVTLGFDAHYSQRDYAFNEVAQTGSLVVPASNPFFVSPDPAATSVNVNYSFVNDLGPRTSEGYSRNYQFTLAPRIDIGAGWQFELGTTYGWDFELYGQRGDIRNAYLNAALADPDPATAFNPFGSGGQNNPQTIEGFRGFADNRSRFRMRQYFARADGPLVELPGGSLRTSLGVEYREDDYRYVQSGNLTTPEPEVFNTLTGDRSTKSAFAEVFVPIFGPGNATRGFEALELSAAVRIEDYSDFGTTTNPRFGVNWSFLPGIRVRGSYGTSFRAPTLADLNPGFGGAGIVGGFFPDPTSPGGQTYGITFRGGNPDLGPETAENWSIGLDVAPPRLQALRLSAGYFSIDYRDIVGGLAGNSGVLINQALYPADAILRDPTPEQVAAVLSSDRVFGAVNPALVEVIIDGRRRNLARLYYQGIDFSGSYTFALGSTSLMPWVAGTYYTSVKTADTMLAPLRGVKGTINYPPTLRLRGGLDWQAGDWRANLVVNHVDGYANDLVNPVEQVDSWTTLDLNLAYTTPESLGLAAGLTFEVDLQNLFDEAPPFVNNVAGYGYDSQVHSPLGRIVTFGLRKRW